MTVKVACSGPRLEMDICYDPHDHVDFSDGWVMSTADHIDEPECVGSTVTSNGNDNGNESDSLWCEAGMQSLKLSLVAAEDSHLKCGTHASTSVHN